MRKKEAFQGVVMGGATGIALGAMVFPILLLSGTAFVNALLLIPILAFLGVWVMCCLGIVFAASDWLGF